MTTTRDVPAGLALVRDDEWPLERLRPDPTNVEIFDRLPDEELTALSLSIRAHGMINPIAVRRDGTIIAGEQRWLAAKQAQMETVPVRIYDVDDRQADILRLAENLHRRNLKPSEMTRAIVRLYEELRPDDSAANSFETNSRAKPGSLMEMASYIGYSAQHLSELWTRRKLVAGLLELADRGVIDETLSFGLARLPQHDQERLAQACLGILQSEYLNEEQRKETIKKLSERLVEADKEIRSLKREANKEPEAKVAELQGQIEDLRQKTAQLLESGQREVQRLREELSWLEVYERSDDVHKAIRQLAQLVDLDSVRAVNRMVEREGMGRFMRYHRDILAAAIPWLQAYHDHLTQALGSEPVPSEAVGQRRALRAVGATNNADSESE